MKERITKVDNALAIKLNMETDCAPANSFIRAGGERPG